MIIPWVSCGVEGLKEMDGWLEWRTLITDEGDSVSGLQVWVGVDESVSTVSINLFRGLSL